MLVWLSVAVTFALIGPAILLPDRGESSGTSPPELAATAPISVQSNATVAVVASSASTPAISVSSGDTLLVTLALHGMGYFTSVTDSAGDRFTRLGSNHLDTARGNEALYLWGTAHSHGSSTLSVTVRAGSLLHFAVVVAAFSGGGASPFAATSLVAHGVGGTPTTTVVDAPGDVLVTGVAVLADVSVLPPAGGLVIGTASLPGPVGDTSGLLATPGSSVSPAVLAATISAADPWVAISVALRPASGAPTTYTVGFDQSGLSGPSWSVTLTTAAGSSTQTSTGTWIVFQESNGSYSYTIGAPSGYTASPGSGSGTVAGHNPAAVGITISPGTVTLPTPIQHVFLIMMENEGTDQIYGVEPYETTLATTYAWGGDAVSASGSVGYYAVCHPSAPNYLAITSGQPLQCGSDGYASYSANNLGNLLQTAGRSWVAYAESATSPCQVTSSGEYAVKHNPFPYYSDLGGTTSGSACMTHVLPIASLVNDYPYGSTPPEFTYIAPNLLDDGHDTSAAYADSWLASFLPALIAEPWFASTVIFIAYDESYGANPDSGYDGLSGGPVYMVAVSPYTLGVGALGTDVSHYTTLSTIEWLLGLPSTGTGNDGTAAFPAMKGLFKFPAGAPATETAPALEGGGSASDPGGVVAIAASAIALSGIAGTRIARRLNRSAGISTEGRAESNGLRGRGDGVERPAGSDRAAWLDRK